MKKIILILLFSLTLFANSDSCKLDVYFGNGVWNESWQAEDSKDALERFMRINNSGRFNTTNEDTYDFKYLHNVDHGTVDDLLETYWQLYESGQISQGYFANMTSALSGVDSGTSTYAQKLADIILLYNINVTTMIGKYRTESLNLKHNVLLVAHSQGNLFGNQMYALLTDKEKKKFKMVSVATPANNVTGNYALSAPYTTIKLDYAMLLIKNSFPGNADGYGHSFVDSYLMSGTLATRVKINTDIINAVNLLDQNSCPQYKHFRWIAYECSSRQSTELEVDIYGSKVINSYGMTKEELITSDSRVRIPKVYDEIKKQDVCPLQGDDFRTSVSQYNKDGCSAYTFDDTSGNYHSLDYISNQTYSNYWLCTQYKMDAAVTEMLRKL